MSNRLSETLTEFLDSPAVNAAMLCYAILRWPVLSGGQNGQRYLNKDKAFIFFPDNFKFFSSFISTEISQTERSFSSKVNATAISCNFNEKYQDLHHNLMCPFFVHPPLSNFSEI